MATASLTALAIDSNLDVVMEDLDAVEDVPLVGGKREITVGAAAVVGVAVVVVTAVDSAVTGAVVRDARADENPGQDGELKGLVMHGSGMYFRPNDMFMISGP